MLPPPKPPPPPAELPLLFWSDGAERSIRSLVSHHTAPPATATDAATSDSAISDTAAADAAAADAAVRLHELVAELHAAARHRSLRAAGALYTYAPDTPHAPHPPPHAPHDDALVVVLLRAPMVLRVGVGLPAHAARGEMRGAADEAWVGALVAALTAAVQPWLAPLAMSMAALAR